MLYNYTNYNYIVIFSILFYPLYTTLSLKTKLGENHHKITYYTKK